MPVEAAMESAARQLGDGLAQAAEHVIERERGTAAKLDDVLDLGEHGALRLARPHPPVGGRGALAPLRHRLGIQAVSGGQGAGALCDDEVVSDDICPIPVGLMDQLIRALGSVKAVADNSCPNSTRTAALPRAITVTAKHAIMKTRTTLSPAATAKFNGPVLKLGA
jgi:hypothetical protein